MSTRCGRCLLFPSTQPLSSRMLSILQHWMCIWLWGPQRWYFCIHGNLTCQLCKLTGPVEHQQLHISSVHIVHPCLENARLHC